MKKYLIPILISIISFPVFAAPILRYDRTILPETTNTYDLGTTTKVWRNIYTNGICLSGNCQTSWPSGGSIDQLGQIGDVSTSSPMTYGMVLRYNTANSKWESVATSTLGLGGGGTGLTNLNGLTADPQTFATSSPDANIRTDIVSTGSTHTWRPYFFGTLADDRIASASRWNDFITAYFATTTHPLISSLPSLSITKSQVSDFGSPVYTETDPVWTAVSGNYLLTSAFGTPFYQYFSATNTSALADSLNKRYVTDAHLVILGNTSGTNTGDNTFGDGLTLTGSDVDCDTASGTVFGCLSSANWTTFNNKQDALVSGTNIKTVNGTTLLGSGDLVVGGTFPFTATSYGVSTSTTVGFLNGLLSTASSTFTSNVILSPLATPAGTLLAVNASGQIIATTSPSGSSGVSSFNTRTGAVTLTSTDVTDALTFTPYNSTNPSGYLSTVDISANTNLTAGDALTLTGDDIDFDGGATPGGSLGGTWASPTIDDLFLVNNADDTTTGALTATKYVASDATATSTFAGAVGIGTTTPQKKLTLGSGAISAYAYLPATTTSMTIDFRDGNTQVVRMGTSATTLGFSNYTPGDRLTLTKCNPTATAGSFTLTGVTYVTDDGGIPTWSTTANKCQDALISVSFNATTTILKVSTTTREYQ